MNEKNSSLLIYTLIYFGFLYIPVLFLPIFSFNDANYMSFPLAGFTTDHYEEMWSKRNLHKALWASVKVGVVASVVSTAIALLAAKAFVRYKFRGQNLAVSILIIWINLGFPLGLVPVTIGHILFCTPFAMLILIARIEGFDFSLEEASRDLGENAWGTFYRVSLPLYLPGIIAALLVNLNLWFVPLAGFFFAAIYTGAAGMERIAQVPKEIATVIQAVIILFVVGKLGSLTNLSSSKGDKDD